MRAQAVIAAIPPNAGQVDADNPWPGLAAFREADQAFFHGRDNDTEELMRLVLRERLTLLFGVSGLGKTSLLQAGLFSRLRRENIPPVRIRLAFSEGAPELSRQVKDAITAQAEAAGVEAPKAQDTESLWEHFHRQDADFWGRRNRLVTPLLVFDQFEEVFTLGRTDPQRSAATTVFLVELADLIEGRCPAHLKTHLDEHPEQAKHFSFQQHRYKVVLSLREDFLADLEGLRGTIPSIVHNRFRLQPMNGEQALQVVLQPGRELVTGDVAGRIVRFLAGIRASDARPCAELVVEPALLSLVCRELNLRRQDRHEAQISAELLEGSQSEILADFYERSVAGFSPPVRSFIEDRMLTVSGYRNSVALDDARATPGVTDAVIDQLVNGQLLRREERAGVRWLELTHDVLTGVVRASRDQRREREVREQAESARREAEAREAQARRQLRRSQRIVALFVCLTIAATGAAVWAYLSQQATQRALADADYREARGKLALGQVTESIPLLAHATRVAPEYLPGPRLLLDLLLRQQWALPLAEIRHESVRFSLDCTRAVTISSDYTVRVWDAHSGKALTQLLHHEGGHVYAEISPDGTRVVTASEDKTARVWDAQSGKPLTEPLRHENGVRFLQFSPDGTRVVTVSGNTARVWEATSGKPLTEPLRHENGVHFLRFSPDGTRIVSISDDRKAARVWDAQTGQALTEPLRHEEEVFSAKFSPNGSRVVTASGDNTARVWDAHTGQALTELRHDRFVNDAQFSPDGNRVVTASGDKTTRVWDAKTGKVLIELRHKDTVVSAQFSPDGARVVTVSYYGSLSSAQIWDAHTGEVLTKLPSVASAQFSPDGTRVVTVSDDRTAGVFWDVQDGQALTEPLRHEGGVNSAQFSPDGTRVVTASGDNTARVWDADSGKPLTEPMRHYGTVFSAQFNPDSTRVVTASRDRRARVWDARTGQVLIEPLRHEGAVESAQFSPDGSYVVTASRDGTARVWDAHSGKPLTEPLRHEGWVISAQFSPDSTRVVTGSYDGSARMWDARSGKPLTEPLRHSRPPYYSGPVYSAQFSPNGSRVVTAAERHARVWDAYSGKPLAEPLRHEIMVKSVQFSTDGNRVVTAGDKTARVWDARTGQVLIEPLRHEGAVESAQFSPDGSYVVTASRDGTARVWDAQTGKALTEPLRHGDGVESAQFSPDGTRVVTASQDNTARVWDVFTVSERDAEVVAKLAEAVAGYQVNKEGMVVPVPDAVDRIAKLREDTKDATAADGLAKLFVRWFLADRWTRTISPLSIVTVPEYIQRRIAEGRIGEVKQLFPGHPLLSQTGKTTESPSQ